MTRTQIRYAELEVVPHPLEARRDQRHVLEDEAPHQIIGHCPIPHTKFKFFLIEINKSSE
jgi:hypothetical protein